MFIISVDIQVDAEDEQTARDVVETMCVNEYDVDTFDIVGVEEVDSFDVGGYNDDDE